MAVLWAGLAPVAAGTDRVGYLPGASATRIHALHRLSDGTVLAGGRATDLDWVPAGVPVTELADADIDSEAPGSVAFLARLSPDLSRIHSVVHFPPGSVRSVDRIRSTEIPGRPTGTLFVSGKRDQSTWRDTGYFIARLDGNFVDARPVGLDWSYDVEAEPRRAGGRSGESAYKTIQPWDVNADGEVYFGRGAEYDFDWAVIEKLDADGRRTVVEHWPAHWTDGGECYRAASDCAGRVTHSGIVMKAGRRGSLRSRTRAEFERLQSDGNGRTDRPGRFPDDYFFSGPCGPSGCAVGPGYTGYRTSDKPTQRLGGIAVDRVTGMMAIGYSTQSRLPGGNPDFEPAVAVFGPDGQLRWWNRLYEETEQNSSPDQYVDAVAVDPLRGRLLVLARAHGNNVVNLWRGDRIAADPDAQGFQNRFTGNSGNIHISWLGAFAIDSGTLQAATYLAEYPNTTDRLGAPHPDPNLSHWPNPNGGWPNVNTTRCRNRLALGPEGSVGVLCTGRRPITTADAHQPMFTFDQGESKWSDFARVYAPELDRLRYSTLLTNPWDGSRADEPNAVSLQAMLVGRDRVTVAGYQSTDDSADPVPVTGTPAWLETRPAAEATGLVARLATEAAKPSDWLFGDGFESRTQGR